MTLDQVFFHRLLTVGEYTDIHTVAISIQTILQEDHLYKLGSIDMPKFPRRGGNFYTD